MQLASSAMSLPPEPSAAHDVSALPIVAEALSAQYDGRTALEAVSFRVQGGQRVAVVGPNGAGKTTLFKLIAGILEPSAGAIRIHGHGPGSHICVAYLPQRTQVDWNFPVTVREVVMMGRVRNIGLFRWARRRDWMVVDGALERVRMAAHRDRQIGELSGGQQQRVFLAQAVAQEADIVLLDEPLAGLDAPSQDSIFEILDGFRQRGVAVLLATHDLNLAAEQFDQVMLLNRRLIGYGSPEEVFTREALVEAYGDHLHVLSGENGALMIADTHLEGSE